jgi:hypothetical protein
LAAPLLLLLGWKAMHGAMPDARQLVDRMAPPPPPGAAVLLLLLHGRPKSPPLAGLLSRSPQTLEVDEDGSAPAPSPVRRIVVATLLPDGVPPNVAPSSSLGTAAAAAEEEEEEEGRELLPPREPRRALGGEWQEVPCAPPKAPLGIV